MTSFKFLILFFLFRFKNVLRLENFIEEKKVLGQLGGEGEIKLD